MTILKNSYLILLILFMCGTVLTAQDDAVVLTKNFKFNDGIYLTYEDFKKNKPSAKWEELKTDMFVNPQRFSVKVHTINWKSTEKQPLSLDQIWGIAIGGIPYLQLRERQMVNGLREFIGLELRGKICYFSFPEPVKRKIKMPVYNPLNGKPFRVAYIEREVDVKQERMMNFESGEIVGFTVDNLKAWILDDEKLLKIINELSEEKAREKLFKCLLIYVDRNEVKIGS